VELLRLGFRQYEKAIVPRFLTPDDDDAIVEKTTQALFSRSD
jgi:hypothetical protein